MNATRPYPVPSLRSAFFSLWTRPAAPDSRGEQPRQGVASCAGGMTIRGSLIVVHRVSRKAAKGATGGLLSRTSRNGAIAAFVALLQQISQTLAGCAGLVTYTVCSIDPRHRISFVAVAKLSTGHLTRAAGTGWGRRRLWTRTALPRARVKRLGQRGARRTALGTGQPILCRVVDCVRKQAVAVIETGRLIWTAGLNALATLVALVFEVVGEGVACRTPFQAGTVGLSLTNGVSKIAIPKVSARSLVRAAGFLAISTLVARLEGTRQTTTRRALFMTR